MEKRDISLDVIKGAACILMVFSHAELDTQNPALLSLGFIGSFAAALFFSVTGVTAWMQADRYRLKDILLLYAILFLAGFSLNGMIQINFYEHFEFEMLQTIAIGALLVFLLQYFLRPTLIVFLSTGALVFFLKIALDLSSQRLGIEQILKNSYLTGTLLPPGTFTIIPWLFIFPLGVYAYQSSAKRNLVFSSLAIFSITGIILLTHDPTRLDLFNKWDMSIGYFLLSCFFLFFSYYLSKRIHFNSNILFRFLEFLGRNSLLFLYVHILIINILYRIGAAKLQFFYWLLVIIFSAAFLKITLVLYPKFNLNDLFHHKITWYILVFFILITPIVTKNNTVIFILECLWGICVSINYGSLRETFRNKPLSLESAAL